MYLKGWAANEKAIHSLMHLHEGCSLCLDSCPFEAWTNEGLWSFWTQVMFGVCFLGVIGGGKIILAIYL